MKVTIQTMQRSADDKPINIRLSDDLCEQDSSVEATVDLVINDNEDMWLHFRLDDLLAALSGFQKKRQLRRDAEKDLS